MKPAQNSGASGNADNFKSSENSENPENHGHSGQMNPGDEVPPGSPDSGEAICPDCAGSGKSPDGAYCGTCDGTGKVTQLLGDA